MFLSTLLYRILIVKLQKVHFLIFQIYKEIKIYYHPAKVSLAVTKENIKSDFQKS